jgi:Arc/MetJ-type ribon-helix-helix transcriptional regulator
MFVMEPLTNRAIGYKGHTTPVNCRMADDMVAFIDQHLDYEGGIASRSDFVQHATRLLKVVMQDRELLDALEWALDRPVQFETVAGPLENGDRVVIGPSREVDTIHEAQLEALRNRVH